MNAIKLTVSFRLEEWITDTFKNYDIETIK